MSAVESKIETPVLAGDDPLAILAESGVDVLNLTAEAREVFDGLSADEARLLAKVNRRLESVDQIDTAVNRSNSGGINH